MSMNGMTSWNGLGLEHERRWL